MDLDEFRMILRKSGVDVWNFIDTAISVASLDYRDELKERRDGIVEKLYLPSNLSCINCDNNDNEVLHRHSSPRVSNGGIQNRITEKDFVNNHQHHQEVDEGNNKRVDSPYTPQSVDVDAFEGIFDDEQTRILDIKDHLEEPDQSEENLVHLLGSLADMDITFKALKETDIGRHVNRLRKNPSNEVRKLVKQLVRKWKELVDEWVKSNTPNGDCGGDGGSGATLIDEDSPVQNSHNKLKSNQNGHHHQVPDFAYSPNPNNGSSGSDKYNSEPERKVKTVPPRRDPPPKPSPHLYASSSAPIKQREQKVNINDPKTLASATKRLQENYQEAQNAKKQRTIQVMNIHEIPKPKNSFFAKNKGGFQAKHW